ncbi:MAG: hypothetical protein IJ375_07625 [Oscillospiraceae bacterium]|nr:hypothetical protein [Oscillospiraceae bacterium]
MELKVGESKTFTLPFILKAVDCQCGKNGLRLERSGGFVTLYVNNGNRRTRYCAMPLGTAKDLKGQQYTVKAQSGTRMLFSVGAVKFVIDYAAKKASTNLVGYRITSSKEWGDNCQLPWKAEYLPLFGQPLPPAEMDKAVAELFWKWFWENESAIKELAAGNRKQGKLLESQVELWLCPIFLYAKREELDFKIVCTERGGTFCFYPGDNEKLCADAEVFGTLMPELLARDWEYIIEE